MNRYKIILILNFLFLFCGSILAFVTFPSADLTTDKTEITIGQPIQARIEVFIPDFVDLLQAEENILIPGWDIQELSFKKDITTEGKYIVGLKITTFDSRIRGIPPVRFSYINKDEINDSNPKIFYFFSNSVLVNIKNIFKDNNFSDIRDIKQFKKMNITHLYYYIALFYGLFVIFVVYRHLVIVKISKLIKPEYVFTCKEKAIKNLNRLYMKYLISNEKIKEHYFELSNILNHFITDTLDIKKEITTTELLDLIRADGNIFNKYFNEISLLFERYDQVKYTGTGNLSNEDFWESFKQTREIIEKF
ncbi:MAG: hypothetical protein PHR82_01935 [Endomicrobiaceae bacterium]|nr:hypothetical protein [Endomicrobiaceae bacterium]